MSTYLHRIPVAVKVSTKDAVHAVEIVGCKIVFIQRTTPSHPQRVHNRPKFFNRFRAVVEEIIENIHILREVNLLQKHADGLPRASGSQKEIGQIAKETPFIFLDNNGILFLDLRAAQPIAEPPMISKMHRRGRSGG